MSKRIVATFHPQAWVNDYAIEVDPEGETRWDVTDGIVAMGLLKALEIRDDCYTSDDLRFSDNAPDWVRNWTGPFYVAVEDSIMSYFEE